MVPLLLHSLAVRLLLYWSPQPNECSISHLFWLFCYAAVVNPIGVSIEFSNKNVVIATFSIPLFAVLLCLSLCDQWGQCFVCF